MKKFVVIWFVVAVVIVVPFAASAQVETHSVTEDLSYVLDINKLKDENMKWLQKFQEAQRIFEHFNSVYKGLNGVNDLAKSAVSVARAVEESERYVKFLEQFGTYGSAREYLNKIENFKYRTSRMLNETKDACESLTAMEHMPLADKLSKIGSMCADASTYVDKEMFMLKKSRKKAVDEALNQQSKVADDSLRSQRAGSLNKASRGKGGVVVAPLIK